ncbi:MAG: hypothetical protein ACJ74H_19645 [Thermoanaerobaculia bacterium]
MLDPASQRALILVLVIGSIVMAIATTTLVIIFRGYGGAKAGGTSHKILIVALLAFVFLCCAVMFTLSYSGL